MRGDGDNDPVSEFIGNKLNQIFIVKTEYLLNHA